MQPGCGMKSLILAQRIFIRGIEGEPVTALAVDNGRVVGSGNQGDFATWLQPQTRILDLGKGTILPGFVESHSHLMRIGESRSQVDCSTPPNKTIGDILNALQRCANTRPCGTWIIGFHYDDSLLQERRHPTLRELSLAVPSHPVLIIHNSGHLAVANRRAFEIAGVDERIDMPGIDRDTRGKPIGLLKGARAHELFWQHIPTPSLDERVEFLRTACKECHRVGVTSATDAAMGYGNDAAASQAVWRAYQEGERRGALTVRTQCYARAFGIASFVPDSITTPFLEAGGIKVHVDGSIQGHTAALAEGYFDQPKNTGMIYVDWEEIEAVLRRCQTEGRQFIAHCNGDQAIDQMLELYGRVLDGSPQKNHRWRIEHAQLATNTQLEHMHQLGVLPSFFIGHVYYYGDRHHHLFLGPRRAGRLDPLSSANSLGMTFSLHSDAPVTPLWPLQSISVAHLRKTSGGMVLGEKQSIDIATAVHAYSDWAAYLGNRDSRVGSLLPGRWADFIQVEGNLAEWNPSSEVAIPNVLRTWVGGELVFDSGIG